MEKAIITVVGKDTVGIIAGICTYLAENKINILDISQTIVQGYFNMMMIVDISTVDGYFGEVVDELSEVGEKLGVTVLLKDHSTVITDGAYTFKNRSGNAGMASAGMGDVLSGIIGAMLAHNRVSEDISTERFALPFTLYRTATAAYIHGLAGDTVRDEIGEYSLTASDLLKAIPRVLRPQK